jgi:hypothetical protein
VVPRLFFDMRHALRVGLGVVLVLVGIAGLILPIMPGWVFLIPGLVILGDYFPPIKRLLHWAKEKAEKSGVMGGKAPDAPPTSQPPSSES